MALESPTGSPPLQRPGLRLAPSSRPATSDPGAWLWLFSWLLLAGLGPILPGPPLEAARLLWVLLFSLILHDLGHALAADRAGDPTARSQGRLRLSPLAHFDRLGSFWMPLLSTVLSSAQLVVGWARPIPVRYDALRDSRQDALRVAACGPLVSMGLAYLSLLGLATLTLVLDTRLELNPPGGVWTSSVLAPSLVGWEAVASTLRFGLAVNLVLLVVNCLPFLPFDGGWILRLITPRPTRSLLERVQAILLLLAVILTLLGRGGFLLTPLGGLWNLSLGALEALP